MKPETELSATIRATLERAGHRVRRIQCGAMKGGKVHLCETGTPDLLVMCRGGVVGWLEVKHGDNTRSPEQIEFALDMARRGIPCAVVRDPVEAVRTVKGWRARTGKERES